jgi:hypothetical protein
MILPNIPHPWGHMTQTTIRHTPLEPSSLLPRLARARRME